MKRLAAGLLLLASNAAYATDLPADPLDSVMWEDMAKRFFNSGPIVFDQRVKVMLPASAEDQFQVPVTVDASALSGVEEIVIVADLNPVAHVLTYRPENAAPFIGLRVKVEQQTPVRAGVRTADGLWHLGGAIVDAAGRGSSSPAMARADANWTATLGQTRVLARREADATRLTVRMRHPMDTGLADGIPAFYLSSLKVESDSGGAIGELETHEPVSENPTFTLKAKLAEADSTINVTGRDNEGNRYAFSLAVPPALAN